MMKFNIHWRRFLPLSILSALHRNRSIFFMLGFVTLGYVGYVLLDAQSYQIEQTQLFEQALKEPTAERTKHLGLPVLEGTSLGRIEISRIGLAAMIQEGLNEGTLRHAVGHFPDSPLPWQRGNVALAGHRDSFFSELRHIRLDDEITLKTLQGSYRYRVETTQVVAPEETEVLAYAGYDRLTLVTCYPFNFVGSAPKRFIVSARKIPE
jgi:sortase A